MIDDSLLNQALSYDWYAGKHRNSPKLQNRVLEILFVMSDGEKRNQNMINSAVREIKGNSGVKDQSIQPRVSIMVTMDLLEKAGNYPDPVTKQRTQFYKMTFRKPSMTYKEAEELHRKNKGSVQQAHRIKELEAIVEEQKAEIRELRDELADARPVGQLSFI